MVSLTGDPLLREAGYYDASVWSYAVQHNDTVRLTEWLENHPAIVEAVGPSFESPVLNVEPSERFRYQHLDFRPIVVARIHQLGQRRVVLNDGLAEQYRQLLLLLSHQAAPRADQQLGIVYYLLIQNRSKKQYHDSIRSIRDRLTSDSIRLLRNRIRSVSRSHGAGGRASSGVCQLSCSAMAGWYRQASNHIATRQRLERGDGVEADTSEAWQTDPRQSLLSESRRAELDAASKNTTGVGIDRGRRSVAIEHRNLREATVKFYLMDVELLFSRKPFSQASGRQLIAIEPNQTQRVEWGPESGSQILVIPRELKNRNLVIEVSGGGLIRSHTVIANSLSVSLGTTTGLVRVLSSADRKPLEQAYVKVYARHRGGEVRFYKDGYTDLRGEFDYATLSTPDLQSTERFAILIIHPEHGSVIREADPPASR